MVIKLEGPASASGSPPVLPFLATNTLATVSGMLVPAANKVRPITVSGIPSISPVIGRETTGYKS